MVMADTRHTVARAAFFEGVGLHSGRVTWVKVAPASPGSGITLRRADLPGSAPIAARWDSTGSLTLCTELRGPDGTKVSTVEHLMCALSSCGIHDALIDVGGPEIPIMDGSAKPFVDGLQRAGRRASGAPLRWIDVKRAIEVRDGDRSARIEPHAGRSFAFTVEFDHSAIGRSSFKCEPDGRDFADTVAPARTFAFESDVAAMRAAGLALGGSLDNAIVVGDAGVLNPGGLRFSDEFARHKALDAVGDLYLAGAPIRGAYVGHKAGHALNNALVRSLMANRSAWSWSAPAGVETGRMAVAA